MSRKVGVILHDQVILFMINTALNNPKEDKDIPSMYFPPALPTIAQILGQVHVYITAHENKRINKTKTVQEYGI